MNAWAWHLRALVAVALLASSGVTSASPCPGRIYDVATLEEISPRQLAGRIAQRGSVLIGERHGVAGHPLAAACLLRHLADLRPTRIALEMLRSDQQPTIDRYHADHPELAAGIGTRLKWWGSGWPAWHTYAPLFESVWQTRTRLVAGDRPINSKRPSVRRLRRAYAGAFRRIQDSWTASMQAAHCGLLSKRTARVRAHEQMARDIHMSSRLRSTDRSAINVLYAGRAHVRKDRAFAVLHARHRNQAAPISVALQEMRVGDQTTDIITTLERLRSQYDVVWFIGETQRSNACERLASKGLLSKTAPTGRRR